MAGVLLPGSSKPGSGDITGVTAGDGLSGGGDSGGVTVTLDLNELTAAAVADGDFIPIIDTNDSNGSRKEAVADLATLFAGDGLTASSSVLAVNVDDSTIETNSDAIRIKDNGVSLAKMAGLTRGSIIYGDTNGDPAALAKGNADQVLTSDGTDIAWADASSGMTSFQLEDGDGTEVAISNAKEVKFIDGDGIDINWTDTDNGTDGDPYDLTFALDIDGMTDIGAALASGDLFIVDDGAGGTNRKTTIDRIATLLAGTGLSDSSAVISVDTSQAITALTGGDLTIYEDANNADVSLKMGTSATESLTIQVLNGASNKTAEEVHFSTATASGTADHGKMVFDIDGTDILTIDDGGLIMGVGAIDITSSGGIILENDETITNSTNGTISFSGGIAVPDAGNIGSASDLDAIAIASDGVVNFTQAPTVASAAIRTAGTEDMWIPAGSMRPTDTNGCATLTEVETTATRPDMQVLDFDSSTQEYAQFSVAMPKSWNEGTVTAQFYWTHATAVDTDVIWAIQGVCVSDNDTIDVAYGTAQTVTDTFHNTAEDLAITAATSAITLGGTPAAGDLAFFQVYRDADAGGDTTNSTDARLIGVKINYTTNAATDA